MTRKQKAFTLIELLVVIAIIVLISSILLVVFNNYRTHARDAQRITDLKRIAAALSVYYQRNNSWPQVAAGGAGCWATWQGGNAMNTSYTFLQPLVTDGEMSSVPVETYWNASTGTTSNSPWGLNGAECSYRYMPNMNFSSVCGIQYSNTAALYATLENPRPAGADDGAQPACISALWGEGGTNDPYGYLLLIK